MVFIYRRNFHQGKTPGRLYLHSIGSELFEQPYRDSTKNEIDAIRRKYPEILAPADFFLAALFGEDNKRVTEMFVYGNIKQWPGNPERYEWVFENGVFSQRKPSLEEAKEILRKEESYRRSTRDLEEYLHFAPKVNSLLSKQFFKK